MNNQFNFMFSLKEYLPLDYIKKKDAEKKIYADHNKLLGISQINSKNRYVQLSRSLKTYGYTFFLVKERTPKDKNKLIACLLGVTKQTIVRVDSETKDIIQQWQLTQLRRWAASPNSFTLDFGDYADAYYSVQTTEGDQISQLIAGYIDIILKKRKENEKAAPEEREGLATVEEFMKPGKATNVSVVTSGQRTAVTTKTSGGSNVNASGPSPLSAKSFEAYGIHNISGGSPTQQTAAMAIRNAFAMIRNSVGDLATMIPIPPLSNDEASLFWRQQTIDVNAHNITSVVAMQLATIGSLVLHVTGDSNAMDYELIASSINQLPNLLNQLSQSLKMLRAILDDEDLKDHLLQVAMDLANSLAQLIDKSQPVCMGDMKAMTDFHSAARQYSVNASDLLECLELLDMSDTFEQELIDACNAVAKAVGDLISRSKTTLKKPNTSQIAESTNKLVAESFEATSRLIMSTMVVNPSLVFQICKEQVVEGCALLRLKVDGLSHAFDAIADSNDINSLSDAAQRIEETLSNLLNLTSRAGIDVVHYDELDEQFKTMLEVISRMSNCYDSPENIIIGARDITLGTTHYISLLKQYASNIEDSEELLKKARCLAEATAHMVAAAKSSSKDFENQSKRDSLMNAVEGVKIAGVQAATSEIRENAFRNLARLLKEVISSSNQVSNSSKNASIYNRNQGSQLKLNQTINKIGEMNTSLISNLKTFNSKPRDYMAQDKLLKNGRSILIPSLSVITSCESAIPTIGDTFAKTQLASSSDIYKFNILELEKVVSLLEEFSSNITSKQALASIKEIESSIRDHVDTSTHSTSKSEKRQTIYDIGAKKLQASMNQSQNPTNDLLYAISGISRTLDLVGDDMNANEFTNQAILSLQTLASAVNDFSSVEHETEFKSELLQSALNISEALSKLIVSTEKADKHDTERLIQITNYNLNHMINILPTKKGYFIFNI